HRKRGGDNTVAHIEEKCQTCYYIDSTILGNSVCCICGESAPISTRLTRLFDRRMKLEGWKNQYIEIYKHAGKSEAVITAFTEAQDELIRSIDTRIKALELERDMETALSMCNLSPSSSSSSSHSSAKTVSTVPNPKVADRIANEQLIM